MSGKQEQYFYFVDNVKYESELSALTGAQIKAKIPNYNSAYTLTLQGVGQEPDKIIRDDESVPLEKDKGPRRFFTAPPATFGE